MVANEQAGSCVISVGGVNYREMLSLNLKRSRNEGTCQGTIVLSWPGAEQFSATGMPAKTLVDGADGTIILDGQLAATVTLDQRLSKGTPKSYELTLTFRGQMSDAIDGSPNHDTGQENKKSPPDVMKKLLEGCKGSIIDQSGYSRQMERFIVAEGETVERACRRAAREFGLTFWETKEGNWKLVGPDHKGEPGGGELRLGWNFTHWNTKRDLGPRFPEVNVFGNGIATDERYGEQNENPLQKEISQAIGDAQRMIRVGVDGDHDKESLQQRAAMERTRRAAQGLNVTLKMSTWSNNSGTLWDVDQEYHVVIPVDEIDDDLVVDEVEFELTPETRSATLVLVSTGALGGGAGNVLGTGFGMDYPIIPQTYEQLESQRTAPEPPRPSEG